MTTKTEQQLRERQERHLTKAEQIDARLALMKKRSEYNKRTAKHKQDTREKILTGALIEALWREGGADVNERKLMLFNEMKESMTQKDRDFLRSRGYQIELTEQETKNREAIESEQSERN